MAQFVLEILELQIGDVIQIATRERGNVIELWSVTGSVAGIDSCTGVFQTVGINVTAQAVPFRSGVAFAQASIFISGGLASGSDEREISIVATHAAAEAA